MFCPCCGTDKVTEEPEDADYDFVILCKDCDILFAIHKYVNEEGEE